MFSTSSSTFCVGRSSDTFSMAISGEVPTSTLNWNESSWESPAGQNNRVEIAAGHHSCPTLSQLPLRSRQGFHCNISECKLHQISTVLLLLTLDQKNLTESFTSSLENEISDRTYSINSSPCKAVEKATNCQFAKLCRHNQSILFISCVLLTKSLDTKDKRFCFVITFSPRCSPAWTLKKYKVRTVMYGKVPISMQSFSAEYIPSLLHLTLQNEITWKSETCCFFCQNFFHLNLRILYWGLNLP